MQRLMGYRELVSRRHVRRAHHHRRVRQTIKWSVPGGSTASSRTGSASNWAQRRARRPRPSFVADVGRVPQRLGGRVVKLWTLDGALERTFQAGGEVLCAAVLPDGDHFVVGVSVGEAMNAILLYHFDRTLVHAFRAGEDEAAASMLAVTPDGQHIISGSHIKGEGFYVEGEAADFSVKVWSVASKSLVATCRHTASVTALAAMPDGMRFLSFAWCDGIRWAQWYLENTFKLHDHVVRPRDSARQPARALRLGDRQALQRQRWRRPAHLQAPHRPGGCLGCCPTACFVSVADKTARVVEHGLDLRAAQSKV